MKSSVKKLLSMVLCALLLSLLPAGATAATAPTDPGEILTEAYGLEHGESLPYAATLTGEIIRTDTAYSDVYRNITVTMAVPGFENLPIKCYRLKGEGTEELLPGDTITVTGTITNYNGVIEFAQGCTLDSFVPGEEEIYVPDSHQEIVDQAYLLAEGEALPYTATLTGRVISVDRPWDDMYQNITVTIVVDGRENYPIQCYRLRGEGAHRLQPGDIITVTGSIWNYNGTIEFNTGCTLAAVSDEEPSFEDWLIADGVATFEDEDQAFEGCGFVFVPEADGFVTIQIYDCDPGYYLDVYCDGNWDSEYSGTQADTIIIPLSKGSSYDFVISSCIVDGSFFEYSAGYVSFRISANVGYDNSEEPEPDPEPVYTPDSMAIVGSELPGINPWDPADPSGDMEEIYPGVYSKTLTFSSARTIVFKFAGNDIWDDTYNFGAYESTWLSPDNTCLLGAGGATQDIYMDITYPCTLEFILDISTDQPTLTVIALDLPEETVTLYVQVPEEWGQVYAYSWNDMGQWVLGEWPGSAMYWDGERYTLNIPNNMTNLVLSDSGDTYWHQTADLKLEPGLDVYIKISGELDEVGKYLADIFYSQRPEPFNRPDSMAIVGSGLPGINTWDPACPEGDMTEYAPGVYEKTLTFDAPGQANFKFVGNDMWDDAWNFGGQCNPTEIIPGATIALCNDPYSSDIALEITEPCTLKFILDITTQMPTLTLEQVVLPEESITLSVQIPSDWETVYAYTWDANGDPWLGEWPGTELALCQGWYRLEIYGELTDLVLSDGTGHVAGDLVLEPGRDAWIVVDPECNDWGNHQAEISYFGPAVSQHIYRVVGNAPWMGNWDPASDAGLLEQIKPGVYVKTFEAVAPGEYEFKITQDGIWDGNTEPPYRFTVSRVGNVTVTFNLEARSVEIAYEDTTPVGDINGDGKLSVVDVSRLYGHTCGTLLTDPDVLARADINGDGKANIADVSKIYAYVRGVSPEAIVDEAYALAWNTSMDQEVTLTGYVTKIIIPYDSYYDNVTVEIVVSGRQNKPIVCYRMTGDRVNRVCVGDTITVTGTLCNYEGEVEFEKGCHMDSLKTSR